MRVEDVRRYSPELTNLYEKREKAATPDLRICEQSGILISSKIRLRSLLAGQQIRRLTRGVSSSAASVAHAVAARFLEAAPKLDRPAARGEIYQLERGARSGHPTVCLLSLSFPVAAWRPARPDPKKPPRPCGALSARSSP